MTAMHPSSHPHAHPGATPSGPEAHGLAAMLKTSTQDVHTRTERHAFQRLLMTGQLGREGWVAQLGQGLLVHRALVAALKAAAAKGGPAASIFREHHEYPQRYEADLRFFGGDPSAVKPLAPTSRLLAEIDAAGRSSTGVLALIGYLYVVEGSTNGAKFISQALVRALQLSDASGLSSLDPHGDLQRERWGAFRASLDTLPLDDSQKALVVTGAHAFFEYMIEMFDAILPTLGFSPERVAQLNAAAGRPPHGAPGVVTPGRPAPATA